MSMPTAGCASWPPPWLGRENEGSIFSTLSSRRPNVNHDLSKYGILPIMDQPDRNQSETDQDPVKSFTPQTVRSAVGRWSVDRYVSLIRPWILIAGVTAALLVLFRINQIVVTL